MKTCRGDETMAYIQYKCPNCGSNLNPNTDANSVICGSCGSELFMDTQLQLNRIDTRNLKMPISVAEYINNGFEIKDGVLMKYTGVISNPIIPDSVNIIGDEAFSGTDIKSVILHDNVVAIGNRAFCECKYLERITLSSSLKEIGSHAFFIF